MKMVKRILKWFFLLLLGAVILLFLSRPYLLKVLRYRTPNPDTYLAFPQAMISPADSVFFFKRAPKMRTDLDTILVRNGENQLIKFKQYFEQGQLSAFVVIRNDSIIYEKYAKGFSNSTLTSVFSGAKSMLSIMIGQALEEGKIKRLEDKVTDYIPELKSNPAFAEITVRNLLEMQSGLEFKDALGGLIKAFFADETKYYYTSDMKAELMKVKLANAPGTVYQYKSIDPILLGWVLENATGKSVAQYFQEHVWKRIGAQYFASFGLDQIDGLANTASRFQVTAIDWAKVGRLYLHHGQFNHHQVVPQDWVRQSVSLGNGNPAPVKGWQKSANHNLWWIPQEGENGDFAAEGMSGQRLYIDPKTNTIIVQFARQGAGDYPYRKVSRYLSGLPFIYPD